MNESLIDVSQDYLPTIVNSIKLNTEEHPHVGDVVLDIESEIKKVKLIVPDWEPNTSYEKGQLIIYHNELYVVKDDFTSSSAFDVNDYEVAATETIVGQYRQGMTYKKGQLITYNGKLYIVTETFTSNNFQTDKESFLQQVSMGDGGVVPDIDVITNTSFEQDGDGLKLSLEKENLQSQDSSISKILVPEASSFNNGILSKSLYTQIEKDNSSKFEFIVKKSGFSYSDANPSEKYIKNFIDSREYDYLKFFVQLSSTKNSIGTSCLEFLDGNDVITAKGFVSQGIEVYAYDTHDLRFTTPSKEDTYSALFFPGIVATWDTWRHYIMHIEMYRIKDESDGGAQWEGVYQADHSQAALGFDYTNNEIRWTRGTFATPEFTGIKLNTVNGSLSYRLSAYGEKRGNWKWTQD